MRSRKDDNPESPNHDGGGTPPSGIAESPYRRFEEAYRTYTNALQDNWLASQGRLAKLRSDFLQRLSEVQLELQKEAQDAHRRFSEQARNESSAELRAAAHREQMEAANAAFVTGGNRVEEIKREYRENVAAAQTEYFSSNDACYRSFLKDVQNAWSTIDPDAVDVQQLLLISQLLLSATCTTHGRLGPT
jgi:hypothetical protein